ncbi:F-box/WD repeat-containing protein 4 isoform X2 [Macrosteles quadrilineatus]|uniref:F-box/WD repeat-containing protein 4 isoform X2 n=1 Tax=Macrosteles quadrilineatus TaxID=74068 RepID=UPI0023E2F496|nr:F-box/WD repeat-containing protein 4 isoform X2 [Macrosteles quadrilineatus]
MAHYFGSENLDTVNLNQLGLKLVDLPTDVLLWIFKFCDAGTLRSLSKTCKRLNEVVSEDSVWVKWSNNALITNQRSDSVLKRYMPWLWLESQVLWITQGPRILGVPRLKDGIKWHSPHCIVKTAHTDDISRFVKADNVIFSGGKDKNICAWSTESNKLLFCQRSNHTQDIQDLDGKRNIIVTGSKDGTVKVWQSHDGFSSLLCGCTIKVSDRVWSVAMDPSLSCLAAGSAGYYGVHPLHLYDLDRGIERLMTKSVVKNGAAVFDIQWECPNTLVTCGFDAILRLWDIRVGCCVANWSDPFGAAGYSLATDCECSMLCGTATHGRVQFWDKRSPHSIQAFFGRGVASSPVYSLSFDPSQLFIAQDSCVNVLDFSHHLEPDVQCADYTSFWTNNRNIQVL